jgi:hypothetical protein
MHSLSCQSSPSTMLPNQLASVRAPKRRALSAGSSVSTIAEIEVIVISSDEDSLPAPRKVKKTRKGKERQPARTPSDDADTLSDSIALRRLEEEVVAALHDRINELEKVCPMFSSLNHTLNRLISKLRSSRSKWMKTNSQRKRPLRHLPPSMRK